MDSQDSFQYLAVARNIYYGKGPTGPVYEYDKQLNIHLSTYIGKDGRTYSPTGLGFSLAMLPAVAAADMVYKIYGVSPPEHFPLQADWLILLTTSFTNSFFGAGLGVVLYIYFRKIKLSHKQALVFVFLSIFTTNLLIYAKNSFAHMMFAFFFTLSILLMRLFVESGKKKFLVLSGVSYGVMAITYNQSYVLTTLPLILFYILQFKTKPLKKFIRKALRDFGFFFLGLLPFLIINYWFESIRASGAQDLTQASFFTTYAGEKLNNMPASSLIEGIYGQLFSPGRSVFLYSPLLLLILIFWFKIKKALYPELGMLILLAGSYIVFYAMQFSYGGPTEGYALLWHGESSWGPRYLIPLLPLAMIIGAHIYSRLSRKQILAVVLPLALAGFYVQLLGFIMPYQIKYHDLQNKFYVNSTEFTSFAYSNLIPRFSPIFMMSKKLAKNVIAFPKTLDRGEYNTRFFDGIDFPFYVGTERWRTIEGEGLVSFDNVDSSPVREISVELVNHPLVVSSESARLSFNLNGQEIITDALKAGERKEIDLSTRSVAIKDSGNVLEIKTEYPGKIFQDKKQLTAITGFSINGKPVNLESIDVPYYSSLGPAMVGAQYYTYGGKNTDPWKFWDVHTQMYERTPDFWWIKPFYYWDYPKGAFAVAFMLNIFLAGLLGYKVFTSGKP